jgi:hypothetical protein
MSFRETLRGLRACAEAQEWAKGHESLDEAWAACPRADWMLWLLARTTADQNDPRFRLTACDFAELSMPHRAIQVARKFANGEASREEMAVAGAAAAAQGAFAAAGATSWVAHGAACRALMYSEEPFGGPHADILRKYFPSCPEVIP